MRSEPVDDRASGIAEAQQLCDFVESFAGRVVAGVADVFVGPTLLLLRRQIKVRVSSRHNQGEHGKLQLVIALLPLFQQNRMDVAFEMIDGNQRLVEGEGQSLGIADAHQQRSGEAGALGDCDGVDGVVSLIGLSQRLPDDGNNRPQMLARCQLRHDAAVGLMRGDLRSHDVRDQLLARAHHRRGGFVAGTFDAEDVGVWHNQFGFQVLVLA